MQNIEITLDKKRTLKLSLRGMLAFEEKTGKSLLRGFSRNDLTLEDCAALIWACLIHEDRDLSYDDVIDMVDVDNVAEIMNAVIECTSRAFPEASPRPLRKKPQAG